MDEWARLEAAVQAESDGRWEERCGEHERRFFAHDTYALHYSGLFSRQTSIEITAPSAEPGAGETTIGRIVDGRNVLITDLGTCTLLEIARSPGGKRFLRNGKPIGP